MKHYDVIVIGAGAAGFMAAITAAKRGLSVMLIDASAKVLEKVRISGGSRCNFTNLGASADNYISNNPHFCKSALAQYPSEKFIALVESYDIGYHEKKLGQLFCNNGSNDIIQMLFSEAKLYGVKLNYPYKVHSVIASETAPVIASEVTPVIARSVSDEAIHNAELETMHSRREAQKQAVGLVFAINQGEYTCKSLVIATGGLSIPQMGASSFAYDIAKQFDLKVIEPRPALVPMLVNGLEELAGLTMDARVSCGKTSFRENILFTHRGLSGPAILQISSYWQNDLPISIDLCPEFDLAELLLAYKYGKASSLRGVRQYDEAIHNKEWIASATSSNDDAHNWPKRQLITLLRSLELPESRREELKDKINRKQIFPEKFLDYLAQTHSLNKILAEYPDRELEAIAKAIQEWQLKPSGTEGYAKAEVSSGGIDTRELDSKTMMSKKVPGLYFIGECVDVTGWLGGYNLQWAWASGYVAGSNLLRNRP